MYCTCVFQVTWYLITRLQHKNIDSSEAKCFSECTVMNSSTSVKFIAGVLHPKVPGYQITLFSLCTLHEH